MPVDSENVFSSSDVDPLPESALEAMRGLAIDTRERAETGSDDDGGIRLEPVQPGFGGFRICHVGNLNIPRLPAPQRLSQTLWRHESVSNEDFANGKITTEAMQFCQTFWQLQRPYLQHKNELKEVTETFNELYAEVSAYYERTKSIRTLSERLQSYIDDSYAHYAELEPEHAPELRQFLNGREERQHAVLQEVRSRLDSDCARLRGLLEKKVEILGRVSVSGTALERHICQGRKLTFMKLLYRDERNRVAMEKEFDELLRLDFD